MSSTARLQVREAKWLPILVLACAVVGLVSARSPKLGAELLIAAVFALAVIGNLMVGLLLFVIISFLDVLNTGGAALSFSKLAGLVLFASWYAAATTRARQPVRSLTASQPGLVAALIGFLAWALISTAWAPSHGAALSSTERYGLNFLLLPIAYAALSGRRQLLWVCATFVFAADLSFLYGFVASGGGVGGRIYGAIGDPNALALTLVAALMLCAPLLQAAPRGSARRFWVYVAILTSLAGILGSGSRGGLIALGVTLLVALVIAGRWRWCAAAMLIVGALAAGVYVNVIAGQAARSHLSSEDTSGRSDLWKVGVRMFEANPLVGVGTGNFPVAEVHYVETSGPLTRADLVVDDPHVTHNMYLDVLDELGLPGLLVLLTILGASLASALGAARRFRGTGDEQLELMARAIALALVGTLVASFFLSAQYYKQLWLLVAIPPALLTLSRQSITLDPIIRRV